MGERRKCRGGGRDGCKLSSRTASREREGDDALYEGVVECCEDVFAHPEAVQFPQKVLTFSFAQVLVSLHYFHWLPMDGGHYSLSQLSLSFREGYYKLLGFDHIKLQT